MLNLSVQDFTRVAAVGGGFDLDALQLSVDDLVQITAAATSTSHINIHNAGQLSAKDLVRIGAACRGTVFFGG